MQTEILIPDTMKCRGGLNICVLVCLELKPLQIEARVCPADQEEVSKHN